MTITEKVAYIKGLMEGMNLDSSKQEVKILKSMADLLEDISLTVSDLEESMEDQSELIDTIDRDLGEVEEIIFDVDDHCHCSHGIDDFEDEEDEEELYEVCCPKCGDAVCINEEMLDNGSISCPNCGENLNFDFDDSFDDKI